MGWLRATAVVGVLAMLAATAGSASDDSGAGPGAPEVVDCETRAQVLPGSFGEPARRRSVVAGPLIIAAVKDAGRRPRGEFRPHGAAETVPWKSPFFVDAEAVVTLTLSAKGARHAVIGVGRPEDPPDARAASVRLEACAADATVGGRPVGPRTPFTGGFRVDGPRCLGVTVAVEGRPEPIRRRIAFGRGTCSR